jgi:hypothetical protein
MGVSPTSEHFAPAPVPPAVLSATVEQDRLPTTGGGQPLFVGAALLVLAMVTRRWVRLPTGD